MWGPTLLLGETDDKKAAERPKKFKNKHSKGIEAGESNFWRREGVWRLSGPQ